ncbi:cysteine peptidase family C39 domain-containing protein [Tenacibaculum sp.]|nr:cysteine peptidase family C39 domain-containing protein [Tenacibaculum sp.]
MKIKFYLIIIGLIFINGCNSEKKNDFPIILQNGAKQCGPICLQMISQYYEKNIGIGELEKLSGMDDSVGVSLLGLYEAAENIGFRAMGVKISYKQLTEAPLPAIIHWNNNHFIVVYRIENDVVWVADPNLGKIQYSKEALCENWLKPEIASSREGIALLIENIK